MPKFIVSVFTSREVYADTAEQALKLARNQGGDICIDAKPVMFGVAGVKKNSDLRHRAEWLARYAADCANAGNFFEQVGTTPEPFPIAIVWKAWENGDKVRLEVIENEEKKISRMMAY